jgi:K+-sensing histidine kinase KdpD
MRLTAQDAPIPSRQGLRPGLRADPAVAASDQAPAAGALRLLAEGAEALAAARTTTDVAATLAHQLARAARAGAVAVWLVAPDEPGVLRLAARWPTGDSGDAPTDRLELDSAPLARDALAQAAPLRVHFGGGASEQALLAGRPGAAGWVVPLRARDEARGVAYVADTRPRLAAPELAAVVSALGSQAATACATMQNRMQRRPGEQDELLTVAAHDLKNVATSIKGYTHLLGRHVPSDSAPRLTRWTEIINQQVNALVDGLNALVEIGRAQQMRLHQNSQRVDLRQVLQAAASRLAQAEGAPRLLLDLPDATADGPWDAARLERALTAALDSVRRAQGAEQAIAVALLLRPDDVELRLGAVAPEVEWPRAGEGAHAADLALRLARALVEAHGGTFGYRWDSERSLVIRLTLPRH